jgi:hypothetical protein
MARATSLRRGVVALVRTKTAVIAAESTTLTDANFPVAQAVDCNGYETVFVGVEIDGGTNPTVALEVLSRDEEAADGKRWKKLLVGAPSGVTAIAAVASQKTIALDGTGLQEVRVEGAKILFRIDAVTNAALTTEARVLVMPGRTRTKTA